MFTRARILGLLLTLSTPAFGQLTLAQMLSRVAEEAEAFRENIPNTVTQETLAQRALLLPSLFRPRIGAAAVASSNVPVRVREIRSEYSVAPLRHSDHSALVEWRQIVTVDGRSIQSPEAARQALSLNLQSPDERLRKRILEEFVHYGLVDVATDYGLILLAFSKRGLAEMSITPGEDAWIGAEQAKAIHWEQRSSERGELAFHGRQISRTPLQGILWVRASDGLPLQVEVWAEYNDGKRTVRDEATVDYVPSPHGFLTPASVLHRHIVDGALLTENCYEYAPFRVFAAETQLNFTNVPAQPPPTNQEKKQ